MQIWLQDRQTALSGRWRHQRPGSDPDADRPGEGGGSADQGALRLGCWDKHRRHPGVSNNPRCVFGFLIFVCVCVPPELKGCVLCVKVSPWSTCAACTSEWRSRCSEGPGRTNPLRWRTSWRKSLERTQRWQTSDSQGLNPIVALRTFQNKY